MITDKRYVDYVTKMMGEGRFMTVKEDGELKGMLFFSISNDPTPYVDNITFEYLPHDETGSVVVFENMICKDFKRKHALQIEEALVERFPNLEKAVWIRDKKNGRFTITHNRRNYHAVQY